jgi:hypothetical protein
MRVKRVRGRAARATNPVQAQFTSEPGTGDGCGNPKCRLNAFVVPAPVPRTPSRRISRPDPAPSLLRGAVMEERRPGRPAVGLAARVRCAARAGSRLGCGSEANWGGGIVQLGKWEEAGPTCNAELCKSQ